MYSIEEFLNPITYLRHGQLTCVYPMHADSQEDKDCVVNSWNQEQSQDDQQDRDQHHRLTKPEESQLGLLRPSLLCVNW